MEIIETQKRGKGYWKFNNDLLTDTDYVEKIKQTINNIRMDNCNIANKNTLWEYIKCQIRTDTIDFSIKRAKLHKQKELSLEKKMNELLPLVSDEIKYQEYLQTKSEWESLHAKKNKWHYIEIESAMD